MKKNDKDLNKKEEFDGIRQECRDCPENKECIFAYDNSPADGCADTEANQECQDDAEKSMERQEADELYELNEAVDDLVDCLFTLVDKVVEARRYLARLDALADAALNYLSAIGVPQLAQEE